MPALRERRGRCGSSRFTSLCSLFSPSVDGRDFLIAQATVIAELAERRVGMPGRHLSLNHGLPHYPGKRKHFVISHQRHRSDVVRAMTGYAVPFENGCYILIVSNL